MVVRNKTGKGGFKDHPEHIDPNMDGRPCKGETWRDYLEKLSQMTSKQMQELAEEEDVTVKELTCIRLFKSGFNKGNIRAIEVIMNRMDGAAKQSIEHDIIDKSIEVIFKKSKDDTDSNT
jgi:hypothetical protein